MKKLFYIFLILFISILYSDSHKYYINELNAEENLKNQSYKELWDKADKLYRKGLPKSAIKIIDIIKIKSEEEKATVQFLKALIYKIRFIQQVEEESLVKIQKELNKSLKIKSNSMRSIIHSMIAEQYWNFYSRNRYYFLNRSKTSILKEEDMRTWSLDRITGEVVKHYNLSLENSDDLKKIKLDNLEPILSGGYKNDRKKYRPTLYDFLAHRAIDFFSNNEASITKPVDTFSLNNKNFLSINSNFINKKITTDDQLSFKYFSLKYLQQLIKFHIGDKNKEALFDVDIKRLKFVLNKSTINNKEKIYVDTLKTMIKRYKDLDESSIINYELALFYFNEGSKYNPLVSEDYRWNKKTALDICKSTIKKYPDSQGSLYCKSLISSILLKDYNLSVEKAVIPGKQFPALLNYKNIDTIFLKAVKTSKTELRKISNLNYKKKIQYFLDKQPSSKWNYNLKNKKDYQNHSVEIACTPLKAGKYILLLSNSEKFEIKNNAVAYTYVDVTNISYIKRNDEKGLELYALDRESGAPLKNIKIQLWYNRYNKSKQKYEYKKGKKYPVDKNGFLNIKKNEPPEYYFDLEFINGDDVFFPDENFNSYGYTKRFYNRNNTYFFTDRSIYRPGQVVYFKGIKIYRDAKDGEKSKILPGSNSTVIFYDVNRQKIEQKELSSDEFGTINGSFKIPTGLLNGNFSISDGYGTAYFSVEEYKRPKFKIEFKPLEGNKKLNDIVNISGNAVAFAGYPVDNAKVVYRVVRNSYYPYRWYFWNFSPPTSEMEILNGQSKTDSKGNFKISFKAVPDLNISRKFSPAFSYTVYADVTDSNGETHSSSTGVRIGYTSLLLGINIPGKINKNNNVFKTEINTTNLSGNFTPAKGKVKITKLKNPGYIFKNKFWSRADLFNYTKEDYYKKFPFYEYDGESNFYNYIKDKIVFSKKFNTLKNKNLVLNNLDKFESGKYILEAESTDSYGNEIKEIKYFTLYSTKENKTPYTTLDWYVPGKINCEPGEEAEILIGSSDSNVKVLYETTYRGKIISKKFIKINNEQKLIKIPIKEEHRGNLGVSFTFIKHNRIFKYNSVINVPWTNKDLKINFETFRNKLFPGEDEEWKIKITGKNNEKVAAQMMATLYDASLDEFKYHSWNFYPFPSHYSYNNWEEDDNMDDSNTSIVGYLNHHTYPPSKYYDKLNWFGFYWYYNHFYSRKSLRYKNGGMSRSSSFEGLTSGDEIGLAEEKAVPAPMKKESFKIADKEAEKKDMDAPRSEANNKKQNSSNIQVRKNFNETAFFFPKLISNKKGEVYISFKIPESLTKWKMLGFAHTKDLKFGFIQNNLITQKDLMIIPNTPRFLREGDKISIAAKITNLTDKAIRGEAYLELFDSSNMKPVNTKFNLDIKPIKFSSTKSKSDLVKWQISIPDDLDTVTYRVIAKSDKFSDGEENILPILKNRMLVTESIPLPLNPKETKKFQFKKLLNSSSSTTLKHHKVTLEFTSNPTWYAVQALPYMMEYPYECLEQTFSRYYANSIAHHIVNQKPKIQEIFKKWSNTKNKNALLSNLEKNQDLKMILLEETPWVLQAKNESERKKRIGLLFDLTKMSEELSKALRKISDGQLPDGSWPWFKGMKPNRYITQHLVSGFAHLQKLNVIDINKDEKLKKTIGAAIYYLDNQIKKDYDWLIHNNQNLEKQHINYMQIHYLYARSNFKNFKMDDKFKNAFNYYLKQGKKYWLSFGRYMQGMISIALYNYEEKSTASDIIKSIKEHALYSEEMGMYWKDSYGFYWYQAPIETHALLIEAFSLVTDDKQSVNEMKKWLLKQKQTQDWKTTKATAEACYALLLNGDDWLEYDEIADITIGNIKLSDDIIKSKNPEAGTGYFKISWPGDEVKPEMGNIEITNKNNSIAWGGLYWQYFENLDKITPHATPLKIEKRLFVERNSKTGPILIPIEKTKIKIGDKIKVRIILKVDRTMEYVHMKDMRASGFEPENVISRYKWQDGLGYYESTKDSSTNFFIDYLPKGTYVFEYPLRATHQGNFSNGITSIQCMYAPEFSSHSEGLRVNIKE